MPKLSKHHLRSYFTRTTKGKGCVAGVGDIQYMQVFRYLKPLR